MSPVMSVLVPTRNRHQYAVPCVRMLLANVDPDVEVVVSDNSTDDATEAGLGKYRDDKRLIYVRTRQKLTVHENFTTALLHSSGEYVGFMGDDDAVIATVGDVARWARRAGLDAVVGRHLAIFLWPDVRLGLYGQRLSGTLKIRAHSGAVSYPDPQAELLSVCRRGGTDLGKIPRSYHGIVARRCLEEVNERTGGYFPGPTPDMASAAALALVVKSYAWVDAPIFVSGTGMGSAGGAGAAKRHDWSVEAAPWISPESIRDWSSFTPRRSVAPTLWAEGVLQACRRMGATDLLAAFNYGALYGNVAAFHWQHRAAIRVAAKALHEHTDARWSDRLRLTGVAAAAFARAWGARAVSLAENTLAVAGFSPTPLVRDLSGVEDACVALNRSVSSGPPVPYRVAPTGGSHKIAR